jgi:hypothetical protein
MTTKTKSRSASSHAATKTKSRPAPVALELDTFTDFWQTPPLSTEDRLARIRLLGQRITRYVQFMAHVGKMNGSSAEAKERAVAFFYERLLSMERELGRIQEELQLG